MCSPHHRTLKGTYLKDYFRRDLSVVSPEHIGDILAKILSALSLLAVWTLICVMAVTFVRAVFVGGDDVSGTWHRSPGRRQGESTARATRPRFFVYMAAATLCLRLDLVYNLVDPTEAAWKVCFQARGSSI